MPRRRRCRFQLRARRLAWVEVGVVQEAHRHWAWEVVAVEAVEDLRRRKHLAAAMEGAGEVRRSPREVVGRVGLKRVVRVEGLVGRLSLEVGEAGGCLQGRLRELCCLGEVEAVARLMTAAEVVVGRLHRCFVQVGVAVQRAISFLRRVVGRRTSSAVLMARPQENFPEALSAGELVVVVALRLHPDWLLGFLPALAVARCAPVCQHPQSAVVL